MQELTLEQYEKLINLVDAKIDSIRKSSYSDETVADEYHELGFIKIKLDAQLISKEKK